jgi:hypothetical protein
MYWHRGVLCSVVEVNETVEYFADRGNVIVPIPKISRETGQQELLVSRLSINVY